MVVQCSSKGECALCGGGTGYGAKCRTPESGIKGGKRVVVAVSRRNRWLITNGADE